MGKKNDKIIVRCVGKSSCEVTGSGYLVECPTGEKILLDLGLYQTTNTYECWKINQRKFDFKPSEITFAAISHLNIDHIGLCPLLVKRGGDCNIYMSDANIEFVKPMLDDSCKIMLRDSEGFTRKLGKYHDPIYTQDDVNDTLPYFRGVTVGDIHQITPNVGIKFVNAGHIYGSCQIQLFIKTLSGAIKTISYSGDLGNVIFDQPFVEPYEKIEKTTMYIGECTYNDPIRSQKKERRAKDIEILENKIRETCIDRHGEVLIPTFALQRTETMLYTLWNIFKDDKNFHIPVYVDSPLAVKLLDCFNDNLVGESKEIFDKMMSWDNIRIIRTVEESQCCLADTNPKIICSSSGMLTQGRSIMYLKKILPKKNCAVITCGYMAEGGIGYRIKNHPEDKTITIDNVAYKNRCGISSLLSFSSHMQYEELMNTYVELAKNGCETIWLVHGDENKIKFKEELEKRIAKINKTTKVVATNRDTVARI